MIGICSVAMWCKVQWIEGVPCNQEKDIWLSSSCSPSFPADLLCCKETTLQLSCFLLQYWMNKFWLPSCLFCSGLILFDRLNGGSIDSFLCSMWILLETCSCIWQFDFLGDVNRLSQQPWRLYRVSLQSNWLWNLTQYILVQSLQIWVLIPLTLSVTKPCLKWLSVPCQQFVPQFCYFLYSDDWFFLVELCLSGQQWQDRVLLVNCQWKLFPVLLVQWHMSIL